MIIVVKALILCGIIIAVYTTLECISFFTLHSDVITSFEGKEKVVLYASYCLYIAICIFFVVAMIISGDNLVFGIMIIILALILFLFTNWIFKIMTNIKSKTKEISVDPMKYVDRPVVNYKNPDNKDPTGSPYITSEYSGMMFNNYC